MDIMGNIVWMASYPKSGNTWLRGFLQNYLSWEDRAANINADKIMQQMRMMTAQRAQQGR